MSNGKGGAITNDDLCRRRIGRERREFTEALRHVGGGAGIEEPLASGLRLVQRHVVEGGE